MTLQPRHLFFALLLHAILAAFLLVSVECSSPTIEAPPVVQGTLIKPSDIPKPSVPAQQAPTPPKPDALPDQGPQQKVVADTQADEARLQREKQQAADKQAEEQKKQAELQQQEEAQKAAAAEKQRQEAARQEELRQQQLALEKQKAQEQAEALKKQQEAEAKRKQEEAKKRQESAAADLQKQLDQEAQQQQSAMHERQKAEQAKRDALERRRLAQEVQQQAGQEYGELAKSSWLQQVSAAIHQNFTRPPGTDVSLKCKLRIQIGPSGQVLLAEIVASSGNDLFDNSVKSAVYKAAPLPLPDDPSLLNQAIVFTFTAV